MHGVRKFAIILIIASFLIIPFGTSALAKPTKYPPDQDSGVMVVDFLVARPIGFASLIIGTVAFIVSSPFSALGCNIEEAYELMIVEPALYTFKRPLGGF
jgi:phosphatidylglycerophosphatase A